MNTNDWGASFVVGPDGRTTHVLVPKDRYDELVRQRAAPAAGEGPDEEAIGEAVRILRDPKTRWHDANAVMRDIVSEGVAAVRKSQGLSQEELARRIGVAQSQVSRYEHNFDGLTMRVLKRIAGVLSDRTKPAERPTRAAPPKRSRKASKR